MPIFQLLICGSEELLAVTLRVKFDRLVKVKK